MSISGKTISSGRLVDWGVVISNLEDTYTTQYVKAPVPNNYKEIRFSIQDTDGAIVENIEENASIELMLLLDNSNEPNPVIEDTKVKVTLVDESDQIKSKCNKFLLEAFKSDSGGYVVKQKLPGEGVLSKNYSGSRFKTLIKVTAENKEVTSDSGSYMVKVRNNPSGAKAKKVKIINELVKLFKGHLSKVPDIDDLAVVEKIKKDISNLFDEIKLSDDKRARDYEGEENSSKSRKLV